MLSFLSLLKLYLHPLLNCHSSPLSSTSHFPQKAIKQEASRSCCCKSRTYTKNNDVSPVTAPSPKRRSLHDAAFKVMWRIWLADMLELIKSTCEKSKINFLHCYCQFLWELRTSSIIFHTNINLCANIKRQAVRLGFLLDCYSRKWMFLYYSARSACLYVCTRG